MLPGARRTHVLVLIIAGAASVVGTHLINTLRREVHDAKELGQYRLLKPLGAGGIGAVYLAEHRMLKRPCAIKLIHPDRAGDPRILARFEPAHGTVEPETLLSARRRCTTGLGFCAVC